MRVYSRQRGRLKVTKKKKHSSIRFLTLLQNSFKKFHVSVIRVSFIYEMHCITSIPVTYLSTPTYTITTTNTKFKHSQYTIFLIVPNHQHLYLDIRINTITKRLSFWIAVLLIIFSSNIHPFTDITSNEI